MNILILSWRGVGHPNAGGAEIVTHEYAKAWVKKGHRVTLFTSKYKGAKKDEIIDGVQIVRNSHDFGGVHLAAWKWYRSLRQKPDIVIDQFHGIPFFTPLYVKGKKIAFIHEVAKDVWLMNHLAFPLNYIYGLVGYLIEPFIFKLFYRRLPFITISESTKTDLIDWSIPAENIKVIPNGIKIIKNKFNKNKLKTIMYLGAIARDKGIEDALETFSIINKDKSFEFWVVGHGDSLYTNSLKDRYKEMLNSGRLKFFGHVSEDKKFELLKRSHVLINPSIREGWGLVNIEANAMGTPVVGYKVPGMVDSVKVGETGCLISRKNGPLGLAKAILDLLSNDQKYKEICRKSIKWSEKFNWTKTSNESVNFIEFVAKLNILLLSWRGPGDPNAGGAEIVAHQHAKAWIESGNRVTLFTSLYPGADKESILDGVKIIRRGSVLLGVHFSAFLWYLFGKHQSFDLVIDHFHGIPFFTPLYVRTKKLAVIHEVAKEVWMLNQIHFPINYIVGIIGYIGEPIIFKLFYSDVPFLTGSYSTKRDLVSLGIKSENISVIHHAILTNNRVIIKNKSKIVVFLGSLAKDKGIEDAVKVFDLINKRDQGWNFWVIGKGDENYIQSLKKKISGLSLTNKVKFFGFVDDKKKYQLLSLAYVLLNPSIKEGWGLINIEANAMGTPVVGYNVAGTKDSVLDGKTGLLSKYGDCDNLAKNIIELWKKPGLYRQFQNNSLNWSNHFKWSNLTKESLSLIEKIGKNND